MKTKKVLGLITFFIFWGFPIFAQTWKGLAFYPYGKDTLVFPLDGVNSKAKVMVVNTGPTSTGRIRVEVSSPDIPNPGGGMAIFPNGGFLYLAPGETTFVSCWTRAVYEGGNPPPLGVYSTKRFIFRFREDTPEDTSSFSYERKLVFLNLSRSPQLSGPMQVTGEIVVHPKPIHPPPIQVQIGTLHYKMNVQTVPIDSGVQFTISNLPIRKDWYLILKAPGYRGIVKLLDPTNSTGLRFELTQAPLVPKISFQMLGSIQTMTGFWRGAVSEPERTVVLFPGQENWKYHDCKKDSALEVQSKIYKFTWGREKLWEHSPGWQTWGGDMSPDGKYVAYALNTGRFGNCYAPPPTVVLLDGRTGEKIWERTGPSFESYELAFSPDGKYLAVGSTGSGTVTLVETATGNMLWTIPSVDESFGQVRRLRFDAEGAFLYSASGDDYLRKIRVSDGKVVWKTFIWGWGWVNGLNFSPDGTLVVVGTKSGDVTMVRTSDGGILWTKETGNFEDVVFSPDGHWIATFTGHIFDAETGELVGETELMAPPYFITHDLLAKLPNDIHVFTLWGERIAESAFLPDIGFRPGEQTQWVYYSPDHYAIVTARDMSNPPQTGVVFYRGEIESKVEENRVGQFPGPSLDLCYPNPFNQVTRIRFFIPQKSQVSLKIYDILGREVALLVHGMMDKGHHEVVFPQSSPMELASGVYFLRFQMGDWIKTRKIVFTK